ncbi:MAG: FlgD immunoglobulin-like domain containing protein [Bacteroidota bacterium]
MKNFVNKYFQFCPKTGKFVGVGQLSGLSRLLFPLIGLAALVWILIRVIPKPSRLSYPCVRTAMPFASGFIGYLAMLALSAVAFLKYKKPLRYYPVFFLCAFVIFGISGFYLTNGYTGQQDIQPTVNATVEPNQPMGVAKGIYPGRVVWVHNPDATNENCNPSTYENSWYNVGNYNSSVVSDMVSAALRNLTGQSTDKAAWDTIFSYHNILRGKGAANYKAGEKIFIKINATSSYGNYDANLKPTQNAVGVSETSPPMVLAVLRQLVNVVGVDQHDIYVGDPMKHIYKHLYDLWHGEFPYVHYLDNSGAYTNLGREQAIKSTTAVIHYSDHGTILRPNVWGDPWSGPDGTTPVYSDHLYTILDSAEYLINIPMLKGHKRAGVTMFAKNHFGSQTRGDASHLHNGLLAPHEMERGTPRTGYGLYRIQVDIMSHSLEGKKNLVYLMDALWATDYELDIPLKWQMAPFYDDYMSSVFASLDPVAIESVGYDFLRSEFTVERGAGTYVQMDGVDDYLHQAADSTNWPTGTKYDPDSTGVHIYSLGVHEHWNDPDNKQYSRNLGTGYGIELIQVDTTTSIAMDNQGNLPKGYELYQNYPNPFNPTTTIAYSLPKKSSVEVTIYDLQGRAIKSFNYNSQPAGYQRVVWNGTNNYSKPVSSGIYMYRVRASSLEDGNIFDMSAKMILLK